MGRSGISAANVLARRGADVVLSDGVDSRELRENASIVDPRVEKTFGREVIRHGDVAVMSPGIPPNAPASLEAGRVAQEVIGEVELFHRLFEGDVVAVTGTDGKSTVTTLAADLLNAAGIRSHAAGNLGNPLCDLLDTAGQDDVVVAEVSCFQLVTTSSFRPRVALVTNLAEDHIEYHGSFDAYVKAKAMVAANQAPGDWFVRNMDDPMVSQWVTPGHEVAPHRGQGVLEVSKRMTVRDGAWADEDSLYLARGGESDKVCRRKDFALPGAHNTENALMAMAACMPFSVGREALAAGLSAYRGLPHRLEFVRDVGGVRFYNDSKATNPHAAVTALRSFDEKVVLIAGGHEKGLSFDELAIVVREKCSRVILCGETAGRMFDELPETVDREIVRDHETAILMALDAAAPSGIVLFSPAASSFDNFDSFEQRGDRFKEIVDRLPLTVDR